VVVARVNADEANDCLRQIHLAREAGAKAFEISTADSVHPIGGRVPSAAIPAIVTSMAHPTEIRIDARPEALGGLAETSGTVTLARDSVAALAFGSDEDTGQLPALIRRGTTLTADGRPWHAGGASDQQELGAVLATLVHYLRADVEKIDVTLVADVDQFATIAKFRAMRLLLTRIAEVVGAPPFTRIHAETAWRSMSRRDPQVNILRATSAAFGAAVGGADYITVLPFDALSGGDAHGQRLAVNTQTILAEEAHLYRVADPAAGSGVLEAATTSLAQSAWARFQDIESQGGIVRAIARGELLRDIAETRDARVAQAAAGVVKIAGVVARVDGARVAVPTADGSNRLIYRRIAETLE
jgi:methylmalonyl-CoA mutase